MPLGYAQDEDELMDMQPYSAISDRDPLEDISLGGIASQTMGTPDVKSVIASRKGLSLPEYSQDPLMQQYEAEQGKFNQFRDEQNSQNRNALEAGLMGSIASQAAMGSQTPEPSDFGSKLASAQMQQSNSLLKSKGDDLDRRQKIIASIEARRMRGAIAENTDAYRNAALKVKEKAIDQGNTTKNERMNSLNIGKTNSLFSDPNINRETNKLNAARSAQTLIDEIKSGRLKGSKNIRNQLTTIMSTIEMGGPGAVHDRQAMGVDNLYTKVKDALAWANSHAEDTIPPEILGQLEIEGNALGDRAAQNYNALVNAKLSGADLSGGDPSIDPGQIHQLASQRRVKFLQGNGYNPENAEPMNRKGMSDSGMIQSAHAGGKQVVKKQFSRSRNQTRFIYSDGTEEIKDGQL